MMRQTAFSEKRHFSRFNLEIPLASTASYDSRSLLQARTHDISSQGLGVIMRHALPMNQPVDLCMVLPGNGRRLKVRGTPVWCTPIGDDCYRIGIRLDAEYFNPITTALDVINARLHFKRKLPS